MIQKCHLIIGVEHCKCDSTHSFIGTLKQIDNADVINNILTEVSLNCIVSILQETDYFLQHAINQNMYIKNQNCIVHSLIYNLQKAFDTVSIYINHIMSSTSNRQESIVR